MLFEVLGRPVELIRNPLLGFDVVSRAQGSLMVLWALGDKETRRVIERAHERAVAVTVGWLEDEVADVRWAGGRQRAESPALVVARFRHLDNRNGSPRCCTSTACCGGGSTQSGGPEVVDGGLDFVEEGVHVVGGGEVVADAGA